MIIDPFLEKPDYIMSNREKELEARYDAFQEWLNKCPLVVTDYQDFTDEFQITFSLEAD